MVQRALKLSTQNLPRIVHSSQ